MKKNVLLFLSLCMLFSGVLGGFSAMAQEKARGWYVKRVPEHKQPKADADMEYISRFDGYYIDKNHGDNCTDKVLYLTFDAGYENGNVARILDTLKKEQVHGAFFVLSHLVKAEPELVCRMEKEGHLVCNHSARHKDMSCMSAEDFAKEIHDLEAEYTKLTGKEMARYFRPPEGKFSQSELKNAKDLGYKTIFWSLAYADWDNDRQPDLEKAKQKVLANTHNGAVILLHPTSATNAEILGDLIRTWKAEGYRFGTLDELTGQAEKTR